MSTPDIHNDFEAMVAQLREAQAVLGVGVDLLDQRRVEGIVERQGNAFVRRILTALERLDYENHPNPTNRLAKQFAAKEAVAKALGTGIAEGVSFKNIEITRTPAGAPKVELSGKSLEKLHSMGGKEVHLSLTDEAPWVCAFALISK